MNSRNTLISPRPSSRLGKMLLLGAAFALFGNAQAQVTVTATAGDLGPTSYTTVSAAFAAINAGTPKGAITITVTANTTEPAPATALFNSSFASSYTSVLLTCAGNVTINSAALPTTNRGIIELLGADNVTIDGDDPLTAGTRNLTIQMATTTTAGTQCVRLASSGTGGTDGADNNTVRNCNIIGGRSTAIATTSSWGILMSNGISGTGGAYSSLNTVIENNAITRCYTGVGAIGASATYLNAGTIIRNNVMGSAVSADNIGQRGINISYSANSAGVGSALIQANDIRCGDNGTTGYGTSVAGIEAGTVNAGLIIERNNIHDVRQPTTSGYHAIGIYITGSATNSGITIRNNFIRDMVSALYTTSITTTGDTYGIYFSAGATNVNIDNNTIALQVDPTTGTVTNHINACVAATVSGVTIASFRNNILVNTLSSANSYGLYCQATGNISGGTVDNNNYYVPNGKVGYYNAAARTTLGDWQLATSKDAAAINYPGPFVSATDLHVDLSNGNASFFNGTGATGTGVTTDIDGDTRGNPPDIGADEFILLTCGGADGGTITPAPASACSGGTYVMSSTGVTTGAGISNQWLVSTTSGGPYLPVSGGSGATTTTYTTGALATGTYYYVLRNTCSAGPVSDDSNELTLTVNPTPTATATNNGPACVGTSVIFDGVPSTAGTYAWSGPNGFTSAMEDPSRNGLILTDAGVYSFTVTVLGCPSVAATTPVVVVNAPAIASTTATPNPTCFNGSSQLNVAASQPTAANELAYSYSTGESLDPMTGATTLVTSSDDDTPGATVALPFPVVFNNSTYTYFAASPDGWMVLNTSAAAATSQYSNAVTSTTNIPKLYPYWDDLATGSNGSVSYVVTGTAPNRILKVQWFVPIPRNTTGAANSTFQAWVYETSGTVEYRYGAMGAGSMSASVGLTALATNFQSVTVSTNTVSTSTANDANAGQPVSGAMYRFAGATLSYSWSPNTYFVGQEALRNPLATNVTAASTAYTVTVSNGSCPVNGYVTLTTSAPITAATISGNLGYCTGLSTTLTAVPTDGAGPYTYLWSPGNQATASIVVTAAGNYSCQVTDNCTGSVNTGSVTVVENANPTPVISPSGPLSFCDSGVLTSSIATGNVWTPGGASTQSVSATASGSYTVTVTDGNGCVGTSPAVAVTVNTSPAGVTANASDLTVCDGALVDLTSTPSLAGSSILSENFNGAAAGWTTVNNSSTTGSGDINAVAWTLRPNGYNTGGSWATVLNSNDASQFYLTTADAGGSGISGLTFLTSPVMNLSNYSAASLSFYHYYRDLGANDTARVQVTINGGTTWTDAQVYNATTGAPTAFVIANISLNAYVGQSAVQFRFRYRFGWDYGWAVDNVTVTGTPVPYIYGWTSVPSGFTSAAQNPTGVLVSPVPTTYTVKVTANGCPAQASVTVNPDNTDTDFDGTPDCSDACPNDPNKIAAGTCGCGNPEPGATCDDGNALTINDVIDANCACAGTLLVNDCLGVPGGPALPGTACDDASACTTGDVYDANCICVGTAVNTDDGDPCTLDSCDPINGVSHVFQDADSDGTCDANDLCPNDPDKIAPGNCGCGNDEPGATCDDGNALTINDVIDANCTCAGTLLVNDCLGVPGGPALPGTACDDASACTTGDVYDANCDCVGTAVNTDDGDPCTLDSCDPINGVSHVFQDADSDGTCDANDLCPNDPDKIAPGNCGCGNSEPGATCDDGNGLTINDVIDANCTCAGTLLGNDCLGVPGGPALPGTACDDNSACTTGDVYDANCDCVGTAVSVDDGNACTFDSCDPINGVSHVAVNTDDGDPCTLDSCDPINGVSHVFQDADSDGTCDANDLCPNDPYKIAPGTCGCGNPEIGQSCNDGDPNTIGDTVNGSCQCVGTPIGSCTGNEVIVAIFTDNTPEDLTWVITNSSNVTIATGGCNASQEGVLVLTTACLGAAPVSDCYGFKLMDASGNGITGGYWQLRSLSGKVLLGDAFPSGANSPSLTPALPSYTAHSFCLPLGNCHIASTSCGRFDYKMVNKVLCNNVPGATSYQFEFSDPDAGFIRRIAVPVNSVAFNQMVTSPLTPGVHYFVRVRTNAAGPIASAHFGGGCEVGIGVAQAVTCTELISAPNYGYSCGQERAFNTNNSFIYATPVVGATEYRFRIYNPSEGYDETFIRSTYILQLKWNTSVAPPLVNASTYSVQVNVKVGTLYSGFCGDVCTITIDNSILRPEASMVQGNGTATLWPNPVRESQVNLSIDGIQDAEQQITVDIQDIYGKQVFAKEFGNSGERFSTILDLPGDIASGVYMVNITVNGQRAVQRLSIIK